MAKSKNKADKATKQAEREAKRDELKRQGISLFYILMFAGNLASAIMYALLIAEPDTGMIVLAGVNVITATYFLLAAIK